MNMEEIRKLFIRIRKKIQPFKREGLGLENKIFSWIKRKNLTFQKEGLRLENKIFS